MRDRPQWRHQRSLRGRNKGVVLSREFGEQGPCARGEVSGVTESLEGPVLHDDVVPCSYEFVKSVVLHARDGSPSQSSCEQCLQ